MGYVQYSTFVNNIGVFQAGLADQTDYTDWAIIGYLRERYAYASKKASKIPTLSIHLQKYVEVNYNRLIQHMPLLGIQHKGNISKRFNKLINLGLLRTIKDINNCLFFKLTQKALDILDYKEHKPTKQPSEQQTAQERCSKATDVLLLGNTQKCCPEATHCSISSRKKISRERKTENSQKSSTPEDTDRIEQSSKNSLSFDKRFKRFVITFWATYPKRLDGFHHYKKQAERMLRKINPEKWKLIIKAVENYKQKSQKNFSEGVIFHAVNWLRDWENYLPAPGQEQPSQPMQKIQQIQEQKKQQEQLAQKEAEKLETVYKLLSPSKQQWLHQQTLNNMLKLDHIRTIYRQVEKEGENPLERFTIRAIYLDYRNEILLEMSQMG